MVKAELEKTLAKEAVYKSTQNGKKTSVTSQIGNTINAVDSIITDLRSSQNGDDKDNAMVDQLVSSLVEIRDNTIRQNPVIVWQNTQMLKRNDSGPQSPEAAIIPSVGITAEKSKVAVDGTKKPETKRSEELPPVTLHEFAIQVRLSYQKIIQEAWSLGWKFMKPPTEIILDSTQQQILTRVLSLKKDDVEIPKTRQTPNERELSREKKPRLSNIMIDEVKLFLLLSYRTLLVLPRMELSELQKRKKSGLKNYQEVMAIKKFFIFQ